MKKIKVNRNNLWTKIFFDQLTNLGVKYACISPGSRSTPLTISIADNKKIKSFVNFDERSSAFFALGLAKASGTPVIIVTTSGTAVAELYPAIVEAYQSRIPLIICTADRPPELIGTGANQTINQHNIFKNHIRWFRDLGLPSVSEIGFQHLQRIAIRAFQISSTIDRGPVHLNFPFRKPLEPNSITDEVTKNIKKINPQKYSNNKSINTSNSRFIIKSLARISDFIKKYDKGIIIAGPMEYDYELSKKIKKLSALTNYPVFADGLSQLRFGNQPGIKSILANSNPILSSERFLNSHKPVIILQLGRTPTSSAAEKFLEQTDAERFVINVFGDKFDQSRKAKSILAIEPKYFCDLLIKQLQSKKIIKRKTNWIKDFIKAEEICESVKSTKINNQKFPNEPSIINETLKCVPSGTNIFIGNSLPVRDLDNFASVSSKKNAIYFNRGASGIDGVTSTAMGIVSIKRKSILIIGDLSFLHDLNALMLANKISIPILIVVINNNGGGIFESLPVANTFNKFKEYFITPHNLNLSEIVKSFGIDYKLIKNRREFKQAISKFGKNIFTSVIEIQTNASASKNLRKKYFDITLKKINNEFRNDITI